jgi:two-component system, NtrC family, nitrogen regulation response regulator NtrX
MVTDILVIDDDEGICEVMAAILGDEGYEVRCAMSAESGLAMIEERQPALILLDLWMAGQTPEEFVATYRQTPNGTASIVVSGLPGIEQVAATIGADAFLSKPFDVPVLLETVQQVLSARAASRDA